MTAAPLIVYYSRTGHTKALVDELAAHLSAFVAPMLAPPGGASGEWHLVRLLVASLLRRSVSCEKPMVDPALHPITIVASPVWMGRMVPPVRAFLERWGSTIQRPAFVLSAGRCGTNGAFREMERLVAAPPVARLCVEDADRLSGQRQEKIDAFADEIEHVLALADAAGHADKPAVRAAVSGRFRAATPLL